LNNQNKTPEKYICDECGLVFKKIEKLVAHSVKKHSKVPSENEENEEPDNLCKICMEHEATVAFSPCGHMMACELCSETVKNGDKRCPTCRQDITSLLRVFIP
jgi:hypothetical protein